MGASFDALYFSATDTATATAVSPQATHLTLGEVQPAAVLVLQLYWTKVPRLPAETSLVNWLACQTEHLTRLWKDAIATR